MKFVQRVGSAAAAVLGRQSRLVNALRPAYERGLNALALGNGIPWSINGAQCRVDARYRSQLGQHYDVPVADFLRPRVRPGQVCFDVGANVGAWVLQFAHWVGSSGRVIAFEPNPASLSVLRAHVDMSGFADRVTFLQAAAGASNEAAIFHAAGTDGMSRIGHPNELIQSQSLQIPASVITLSQYCRSEQIRPDWILIDVEGYEGNVL
ncbi:MAG: FkbM family methyltransferase, partial [Longimicrobiales bacterium]